MAEEILTYSDLVFSTAGSPSPTPVDPISGGGSVLAKTGDFVSFGIFLALALLCVVALFMLARKKRLSSAVASVMSIVVVCAVGFIGFSNFDKAFGEDERIEKGLYIPDTIEIVNQADGSG